jgi:hypothetical protein
MLAYLYFLAKVRNPKAFFDMLKARFLWLASQPGLLVRRLVKLLKTMLYGKKKALLIGIQQVADIPQEAPIPIITTTLVETSTGGAASLIPGRPRAMKKLGAKKPKAKAKKPKPASPETPAPLRGPHHDVRSMQTLLIGTIFSAAPILFLRSVHTA